MISMTALINCSNLHLSVEFVEGESSKLIQSLALHKALHKLATRTMLQIVHSETGNSR